MFPGVSVSVRGNRVWITLDGESVELTWEEALRVARELTDAASEAMTATPHNGAEE